MFDSVFWVFFLSVLVIYIFYRFNRNSRANQESLEVNEKLRFLKNKVDFLFAETEKLQSHTKSLETEIGLLKEQIKTGYTPIVSEVKSEPESVIPEAVVIETAPLDLPTEVIITPIEEQEPLVLTTAAPINLMAEIIAGQQEATAKPIVSPSSNPDEVIVVPGRRKAAFEETPRQNVAEPTTTDFEDLLGRNLLGKVGIGVLVLGIGFFVRYAIDQGWLNETIRMVLGILAGLLLVGLAQFKFKDYRTYSSLLMGGGFAAIFLSVGLGYHEYQILSKSATAAILAITTIMVYSLSAINDRIEMSITAFVGGFALPFIASDGSGSVSLLFTYYLILNGGTLALALQKNWTILLNISAFFVWVSFSLVLTQQPDSIEPNRYILVMFSLLYFFIFFATAVYISAKRGFALNVIYVLGTNTFFSILFTEILLHDAEATIYYKLVPALMGSFIFVVGWYYHFKASSKDLATVLFTLAAGCFVLTAPIAFEAENIALMWFTLGMVIGALNPVLKLPYQKQVSAALLVVGMLPIAFFFLVLPYQQNTEVIEQSNLIRAAYMAVLLWLYKFKTNLFFNNSEEAKLGSTVSLYVATVLSFTLGWGLVIYFAIPKPIDFWQYEYVYLLLGIASCLILLQLGKANSSTTANAIRFLLLPSIVLVVIFQMNNNPFSLKPFLEPEFLIGLVTFGLLLIFSYLANTFQSAFDDVFELLGISKQVIGYIAVFVLWATLQSELHKVSMYMWDFSQLQFAYITAISLSITALLYSYLTNRNKDVIAPVLSLIAGITAIIFFIQGQVWSFLNFDRVTNFKGMVKGFEPWQTTDYLLIIIGLALVSTWIFNSKALLFRLVGSQTNSAKSIFRIGISVLGSVVMLLLLKNLSGNYLLPDVKLFDSVSRVINSVLPVVIGTALIIYGFNQQIPQWRKIGLVFIAIIVVKLHLIDVWGYSGVMKIITFISLGVMMLVASFLFQKIKKVIE